MRRIASETIETVIIATLNSTLSYNDGSVIFTKTLERNTYEDGTTVIDTIYRRKDNRELTSASMRYAEYSNEKSVKRAIKNYEKSI